jgi:preprotein translocase subunit SecA
MLNTFFPNQIQQFLVNNKPQLREINNIGNEYLNLSDKQLQLKTLELKTLLTKGPMQSQIINQAFALVREATSRVLNIRHYDVQILGGLILNEGKVAEMKTGEGKTIVALLPIFLNALYGKGTHVVTVNDYLARRDAEYVGQVHRFLGLSVGLIQENMTSIERKKNYDCDVVYVTNNELGFDYLRDNMAFTMSEIVQRPFFYALVDEVDSILIDEARTPLIISGPSDTSTQNYAQSSKIAAKLKRNIHYLVDEKNQNIVLLEEGILFCEQALNQIDLYQPENPWIYYILNSLKAKELFKLNTNYIINEDNEIVIVDEFTGRTMYGRRWSDGLHQAVEAKESVTIQNENQTLASITYQNLFLLYEKLSGMTGTAKTEELEFEKIYNLKVVQIPTHQPIIRKDFPDLIYKNQYIKWQAIAQECIEMNKLGRPLLIGTTTIEKSELLATLLNEYKISYELLNARPENVKKESEIIAQAGKKGAVTIATNMAGRGTDIVLGGSEEILTFEFLKEFFKSLKNKSRTELEVKTLASELEIENYDSLNIILENYETYLTELILLTKQNIEENRQNLKLNPFYKFYTKILIQKKEHIKNDKIEILKLGGLHVIGTERHESRRIDNQLRGRSGRQGDPGSSRFFLSLDDKLLRLFGSDQILAIMKTIGFEDTIPIQSPLLNQSLESAQKKIEAYYYETRKQLFDYDQPLIMQRNGFYNERKSVLQRENVRDWIIEYAERTLYDLVLYTNETKKILNTNDFLNTKVQELLGLPFKIILFNDELNTTKTFLFLCQQFQITYNLKEIEIESIERGLMRELERTFLLQQLDFSWKEHLQKISFLKDSIRWRAYGQKDPLTEYKKEAFNFFITMLTRIRHRVIYFVLRSKIVLDN